MIAVSAATVLRPLRRSTIYCSAPLLVADLNILVEEKQNKNEIEDFLAAYSLDEPVPKKILKCRYVTSPLEIDEHLTAYSL